MQRKLWSIVYLLGASLLILMAAMMNAGFVNKRSQLRVDESQNLFPLDNAEQMITQVDLSISHHTSLQKERRHLVNKVCDHTAITGVPAEATPELFSSIFVNDKHRILYCQVPKVGSTNWLRVMLVLSGMMNTTDTLAIDAGYAHSSQFNRKLDSFTTQQVKYRLKHYFKFMFVREPLERLVSAYKNKFTMPYNTYFPEKFGRKIIRQNRKKPSAESLRRGHDVTFDEFVHYLLNPKTSRLPLNEHWRHYYKLCHPCLVDYDFVGKYETMTRDVNEVLKLAHVDHLVSYPAFTRRTSTHDIMRQLYTNVTSEELHELWRMYSVDYAMYGYPYPNFTDHIH